MVTDNWEIDSVFLETYKDHEHLRDERRIWKFKKENITQRLFEVILGYIEKDLVEHLSIINSKEHICLTVYVDGRKSVIAIIDEANAVNFYCCDGCNDGTYVDIGNNVFPNQMVCYQPDIVSAVVEEFIKTGKRLEGANWLEEIV